jgi:hypothetical protein
MFNSVTTPQIHWLMAHGYIKQNEEPGSDGFWPINGTARYMPHTYHGYFGEAFLNFLNICDEMALLKKPGFFYNEKSRNLERDQANPLIKKYYQPEMMIDASNGTAGLSILSFCLV